MAKPKDNGYEGKVVFTKKIGNAIVHVNDKYYAGKTREEILRQINIGPYKITYDPEAMAVHSEELEKVI
jgi:hypothetical protein